MERKDKSKKYSAEFKSGVILDMREHHLGYCETVQKYGICPKVKRIITEAMSNGGNAYTQRKKPRT